MPEVPDLLGALQDSVTKAREHRRAQAVDEPVERAITPEQARSDGHLQRALSRINSPDAIAARVSRSRQFGVGGLLPPLDPLDPAHVAEVRQGALDHLAREEALGRVRLYMVERDEFYGDEALDDDLIDYSDGSPGSAALLYSDLRLLVGIPTPTEET